MRQKITEKIGQFTAVDNAYFNWLNNQVGFRSLFHPEYSRLASNGYQYIATGAPSDFSDIRVGRMRALSRTVLKRILTTPSLGKELAYCERFLDVAEATADEGVQYALCAAVLEVIPASSLEVGCCLVHMGNKVDRKRLAERVVGICPKVSNIQRQAVKTIQKIESEVVRPPLYMRRKSLQSASFRAQQSAVPT